MSAREEPTVTAQTDSECAVERIVRGHLTVATDGQGCTDLSAVVAAWLSEIEAQEGVLHAIVKHTTASLTVQENADDDVQRDLIDALARLAPPDAPYRHSAEGSDDMPAHVKAVLSDASIVLGVAHGRPTLGRWQALYLLEHRDGGRSRTVDLHFLGR